MKRLEGRVAVVTGAASGIGRATSIVLAKSGCDLALADVDEKGLTSAHAAVQALGRKASVHVVDVSRREAMARLPDEVMDIHGHVNIVMNNAGVGVGASVEEHDLDDFEWLMGINFWGVVYGSKFFLPLLKRQDEAHIVNISSLFGLVGLPTQSAYCASKFAVRGFTESLRSELRGTSVGVTAVFPGGINTNIARASRVADEALKAKAVKFFATKTLSAEAAAEQIVDGIRKNSARVLITREAVLGDIAKRVAPVATNWLTDRIRKQIGL